MRFQVILAAVFGTSCLTLKVLMTRHYGIVGVPWATLITHLLIVEISCAIYIPRALKHLRRAPNFITMATPAIEE
jgi:hypothetical protein